MVQVGSKNWSRSAQKKWRKLLRSRVRRDLTKPEDLTDFLESCLDIYPYVSFSTCTQNPPQNALRNPPPTGTFDLDRVPESENFDMRKSGESRGFWTQNLTGSGSTKTQNLNFLIFSGPDFQNFDDFLTFSLFGHFWRNVRFLEKVDFFGHFFCPKSWFFWSLFFN